MHSPSVLIVDDHPLVIRGLRRVLNQQGIKAVGASNLKQATAALRYQDFAVVILDLVLGTERGETFLPTIQRLSPTTKVLILTGNADIDSAVSCIKSGALEYFQKGSDEPLVAKVVELVHQHRALIDSTGSEGAPVIVFRSRSMRTVLSAIDRVATSQVSVLLLGETGTGKELLAERLHYSSGRRGPLVKVNCGALPAGLFEAQLFGHVRGAFTGAHNDAPGLISTAHGGTLFLDEIGELSPEAQVKLLRVLESGFVRPLGAATPVRTDVRVVAATNRDVTPGSSGSTLRTDLYYRVAAIEVSAPPLRERREDIELLAHHFLALARERGCTRAQCISPEGQAALERYDWPGNVRQLKNTVEHAAAMSTGAEVPALELRPRLPMAQPGESGLRHAVRASEAESIQSALRQSQGDVRRAAQDMAVPVSTLYRRMSQLGIRSGS